MPERIARELRPVAARRQRMTILRSMAVGLLVGSIAAAYFGSMRLIGRPVPIGLAVGFLVACPLLGMLYGLLRGRSLLAAARAVDAHYRLKDRTVTALDFLSRPEAQCGVMHELAIQDAESRLSAVKAADVVPFRFPRTFPYAIAGVIVATVLLVLPLSMNRELMAASEPIAAIQAEGEKRIEDFKNLDKLAKEEGDDELAELVKELTAKAEEMKQPGVDVKEALAKLSEMQAAIAQKQAKYNVGLVDGQLQSLGAAMMAADALQAAGQALQDGKFDQAAKELEKLNDPPTDKKETKSLEDKLKQVAESMGEVGLGSASEATSELAEGIRKGNKSKFLKATRTMAAIAKSHGKRKKIKEILDAEVEELNESKGKVEESDKASRTKRPEKSTSPSTNWGLNTSGNTLGDKTKLQSKRDVKEITGNPGDGPSEMETTHSVEGKQQAARGYKESYQKYKKMSEAVLDSEPIPLGHRQTIRKYFELIRPQGGGSDIPKTEAPKTEAAKPAN